MDSLPVEILSKIAINLNSLEDVEAFCNTSVYHKKICKMYSKDIAKRMISIYKIDYKDPGNFIYKINNVSINEYKDSNGNYNYKKIIRLYMNYYNQEQIYCTNMDISSIPIYPKLKDLTCAYNELTELPELPNLIELNCDSNQINELKMYNNLEILFCRDNDLKHILHYPKLKRLYCGLNDLETLPEFSSLEVLMCENNNINDLPSYPNLIELHCDSNINVSKFKYPNLKFLNDRPFRV